MRGAGGERRCVVRARRKELLGSRLALTPGPGRGSGRWRDGHDALRWGMEQGVPRWSRLLQSVFAMSGRGLELLGLLFSVEAAVARSFPGAPRQGFLVDSPCLKGKENALGLCRAARLSLGLSAWEERSSSPLFCPERGVSTVAPDLRPPPPIARL